MSTATLQSILQEYGVEVVPTHMRRRARQTHAGNVLARVLEKGGEQHLRDVLTSILESENNAMALIAPIIAAVSALHYAHARWFESDASAWLAVFDRVNLVELHDRVKRNRVAAKPVHAIAAELYNELALSFDGPFIHPSLFNNRGSSN